MALRLSESVLVSIAPAWSVSPGAVLESQVPLSQGLSSLVYLARHVSHCKNCLVAPKSVSYTTPISSPYKEF